MYYQSALATKQLVCCTGILVLLCSNRSKAFGRSHKCSCQWYYYKCLLKLRLITLILSIHQKVLCAVHRQTSAHWQELLKQHVPATKQMNLKLDESVIHEELNVAWAGESDIFASTSLHAKASATMLFPRVHSAEIQSSVMCQAVLQKLLPSAAILPCNKKASMRQLAPRHFK